MISKLDRDQIREICRIIKPYFAQRLGEYTHKRITDEWYFHGMAFVKEGMFYVSGINIGFFREFVREGDYTHLGMNVLITRNGENPQLRTRIYKFFRDRILSWITHEEMAYRSERGGEGAKFIHYKRIDEFENEEEIIEFLKDAINGISRVFPAIVENPGNVFDGVLRAQAPWDTPIIEHCKKFVVI